MPDGEKDNKIIYVNQPRSWSWVEWGDFFGLPFCSRIFKACLEGLTNCEGFWIFLSYQISKYRTFFIWAPFREEVTCLIICCFLPLSSPGWTNFPVFFYLTEISFQEFDFLALCYIKDYLSSVESPASLDSSPFFPCFMKPILRQNCWPRMGDVVIPCLASLFFLLFDHWRTSFS